MKPNFVIQRYEDFCNFLLSLLKKSFLIKVLSTVLGSKSVFDSLDELELRKARGRCNPYESIGKMFFQNRAALKMANIDAACNFMFTQPKNMQVGSIIY
jgi:cap1 methyltransferase